MHVPVKYLTFRLYARYLVHEYIRRNSDVSTGLGVNRQPHVDLVAGTYQRRCYGNARRRRGAGVDDVNIADRADAQENIVELEAKNKFPLGAAIQH